MKAFIVFLLLLFAIGVFYCSRASFERRKKVGDVFFFCLQLKSFYCSRVCFERRKESGWWVSLFAIEVFLLLKSLFWKEERKWVMLCLVFSLFAIGLFYCSKICFWKEKENGWCCVWYLFVCNSTILLLSKSFFLKRERKWVMLCLMFFLFAIELFYSSRVCFERIWKGQIRWAMRKKLDISAYDVKRRIERSIWW
jgi:hypothetical protein